MSFALLDHLDAFIAGVAAVVTVFNLVYFRRLNSVCVAAIGFVLVQALSVLITTPIRDVMSGVHPRAAIVLFYFTFAFIDLLAIVVIYRLHNALEIEFDSVANISVKALQALAALQVIRYLDRAFGINILKEVYTYAVPSLNVALLMVLIFGTVVAASEVKAMTGVRGD